MSQPPTLTPLTHGALDRCFGCGTKNKYGLRLKFFSDDEMNIVCPLRLPQRFEGPPGYTHGGIIATLLDEAMSKANRARGILAMTRHIEVEYLRPVPLKMALTLTARHNGNIGRKHHCEAKITNTDGLVFATGKALFIAVDPDYLRKKLLE
jgi:uncharacterized protein (TIGR00369 family)